MAKANAARSPLAPDQKHGDLVIDCALNGNLDHADSEEGRLARLIEERELR